MKKAALLAAILFIGFVALMVYKNYRAKKDQAEEIEAMGEKFDSINKATEKKIEVMSTRNTIAIEKMKQGYSSKDANKFADSLIPMGDSANEKRNREIYEKTKNK